MLLMVGFVVYLFSHVEFSIDLSKTTSSKHRRLSTYQLAFSLFYIFPIIFVLFFTFFKKKVINMHLVLSCTSIQNHLKSFRIEKKTFISKSRLNILWLPMQNTLSGVQNSMFTSGHHFRQLIINTQTLGHRISLSAYILLRICIFHTGIFLAGLDHETIFSLWAVLEKSGGGTERNGLSNNVSQGDALSQSNFNSRSQEKWGK